MSPVVSPHGEHAHDLLGLQDFIYESVVDIDSTGVAALEVSNQLLVRRWVLIGVHF